MTFNIYLVTKKGEKSVTGDDPYADRIKNITDARKKAFWSFTARGFFKTGNRTGDYKVLVYQYVNDMEFYCGEVTENAKGERYWKTYSGNKYELKSDGRLGKKLR